jgi:uncharacterized protein YgbK (DUF1537 family)
MSGLRLLADDLTGALDAAAPFAAARAAIAVRWRTEDDAAGELDWPDGDAALSTSSRALPEPEAARCVGAVLAKRGARLRTRCPSQKVTVAASVMAAKTVCAQRS